MTVATSTSKSGPYAGAGTVGPFTVGFRFLDNAHLQVVKTSTAGVETTLALGTHYTVTGAGAETGAVTLLAVLAVGEKLTIIRNVPSTQEADYVQNDAFPAASHEQALDKLTMLDQQSREQLTRAMKLPVSLEGVSTAMPVPVAGRGLKWNAGGTAVVNSDQDLDALAAGAAGQAEAAAASAAAAAASYDALDDRFLGSKAVDPALDNDGGALASGTLYWNTVAEEFRVYNGTNWQVVVPAGNLQKITYVAGVDFTAGTTTTLTLPIDPITKANLDIVFDAAWQQMTEFSLAGTVVTFNAPIPVGVAQVEISYTTPLQISTVSDGTVTDAKVSASAAISSEKLTFLQVGTGAVPRSAQNKMRDIISVKDFGAVGDGTTDDTAAIQATVDAVAAMGGGTIRIPDTLASYRITFYILVPSNITIIGDGRGTAIKRDFVNGFAFVSVNSTNVRIADMRIISTTPSVTIPSGAVGFQNCTYCSCENVDISGMRQFGVWLYDSSYCVVRGNSFSGWIGDYQQDAADISILNNSNYNIIENNHCFGGGDHGISVQDTYADATPTGNKIVNNVVGEHTAYGILVYVTNNFNTLTLVSGNTVRDIIGSSLSGASGAGIYIQSAGGSVVTNNTIVNCCRSTTNFFTLAPAGIGVTTPPGTPSWPIIVSGNSLDSVRGPGIAVIGTGGPVSVMNNVVTLNCADAAANPVSIYISNAPRATVSGNTIDHTSPAYAVSVVARSEVTVVDVSITNNDVQASQLGLSVNRIDTATFESVRITGNYVKGASTQAAIIKYATGVVMTNNILNSPVVTMEMQFCPGAMISNNGFYGPAGSAGVIFANACTGSVFSESNVLSTRMENNAGSDVIVSRFGSAPPAVGVWNAGDRFIQSVPVVGNPKGWRCTVSGLPGTWVSEGNL